MSTLGTLWRRLVRVKQIDERRGAKTEVLGCNWLRAKGSDSSDK
jgi:hypothetical protein